MARRTKIHQIIPWTGGVNTSVDEGMIPDQDLTKADNVQFTTSGARIKRQGFSFIDAAVPTPTSRESSGTTRTLYFEASGDGIVEGTDNRLVVGEKITVTDSANSSYNVTNGTVLTVTSTTITYTGTGSLTEAKTATTTATCVRTKAYIDLLDYWYLDTDLSKSQLLMAATDQFKLFKFDSNLNRAEVAGQAETTTVVTVAAAAITSGDYFSITSANDATTYWVWFDKDSGGGAPSPTTETLIEVDILAADTDAQVATKLQTVLEAHADFSATVATATVTVVRATAGACTDAADVSTGFTINTTIQGATLPTTAPTRLHGNVMNNLYIMAFPVRGNKPVKFDAVNDSVYKLLGGSPPDFSISSVFLGRLWTNDKDEPDRLHYSATGDVESWLGTSDSGALDIDPGDGDDAGITAIYPYQNILYVAKGQKIYRIRGETPETFSIEPVTNGLGVESHKSVVSVDNRDVAFVSRRGFHSTQATDQYGDTETTYLSKKIQPTFDGWSKPRLKYTQATYIPSLNSVVFAVSEGGSTQDNLWLYNVELAQWYRWPTVSAASIARRFVSNEYKLVVGTYDGRVFQAQNGLYEDFDGDSIQYEINTGTIYPGNDAVSRKVFKSMSLLYRPKGRYRFAVRFTVDNHTTKFIIYEDATPGNALGTAFILGESALAVAGKLQPFTKALEGYGIGCDIKIVNDEAGDQVEVYGLVIEYETADFIQEPSSDTVGEG